MDYKKRSSAEEALTKIKQYCAYRERCHHEVQQKLYGYGLYKNDVEQIMANLIENNYLNEERFAIQYAGGKFRMNNWGKRKITYELQQKRVSSYCVKLALKEIDPGSYNATINKLALTKWKSLTGHHLEKQAKVFAYLSQKGFETNLISKAVNEIVQADKLK